MGQDDVLKILKKNPEKWHTAREVSLIVKGHPNEVIRRIAVGRALLKLLQNGMVDKQAKLGDYGTVVFYYKYVQDTIGKNSWQLKMGGATK